MRQVEIVARERLHRRPELGRELAEAERRRSGERLRDARAGDIASESGGGDELAPVCGVGGDEELVAPGVERDDANARVAVGGTARHRAERPDADQGSVETERHALRERDPDAQAREGARTDPDRQSIE